MGVLLFAACARQDLDSSFVGTFKLQSRDGQPLPAPMRVTFQGQDCTNELHVALLTINSDGTWSELAQVEHHCSVGNGETRIFGPHAFEAKGDAIRVGDNPATLLLTSQDLRDQGHSQVAVVKGSELQMTFATDGTNQVHTYIYRR